MARSPRSAQTRRADEHPMAATRYRGKLYVDQHKVKKGYTYRWVRESSRNEADPSNVTDAQINNWQPVPASLHPEMVPPALPGDEAKQSQVIRRGGLILMMKPTHEVLADRRAVQAENMENLQGIADFTSHADELMPRFNQSSKVHIEQVVEKGKFKE